MAGHTSHVTAEARQTSLLITSQQTSTHFLHAVGTQAVTIAQYHLFRSDHRRVTHDFILALSEHCLKMLKTFKRSFEMKPISLFTQTQA